MIGEILKSDWRDKSALGAPGAEDEGVAEKPGSS